MIETRARVVGRDGRYVWVETQRRSSCEACLARTGCGTAALGRALGRRRSRVRALNEAGAGIGDEVIVALAERALLAGSAALYLVPLLAMLCLAMLGHHLSARLGLNTDAAATLLGGLGLASGLAWTARFGRAVRLDPRYQPIAVAAKDR